MIADPVTKWAALTAGLFVILLCWVAIGVVSADRSRPFGPAVGMAALLGLVACGVAAGLIMLVSR